VIFFSRVTNYFKFQHNLRAKCYFFTILEFCDFHKSKCLVTFVKDYQKRCRVLIETGMESLNNIIPNI
jgi:hypothetical protein